MKVIQVLFHCHECRIGAPEPGSKIPTMKVTVPARKEGQDMLSWMDGVVGIYVRDKHNALSPNCKSDLADIAIPIEDKNAGTKADQIGGPLI